MNEPDIYLPLNARSLNFRWRGTTYDISVEKHFLTATTAKTSFRTTFRTTSKTPLSNLLDEFVVDTPRSSTAQFHTPRFVYSLVAALITQFSAVPRFVPALAPVLFGFALIHLIGLLRHATPMQQTRILNYYGAPIVAIPHLPELEVGRRRFEEQLRDAIKQAKAISLE